MFSLSSLNTVATVIPFTPLISFTLCKFKTTEPAWVTDAPMIPTEQTTRIPVTIGSYSHYTSVSQSIRREATAVSLMDPEETTTVFKKGFASTVVEDYTKKKDVKEDNRPTTDLKLNDQITSVPRRKTITVQTTGTTDVTNLTTEAASKTTTHLTTAEDKNVIFENDIISEGRANVQNSDMVSKTGLIINQTKRTKFVSF